MHFLYIFPIFILLGLFYISFQIIFADLRKDVKLPLLVFSVITILNMLLRFSYYLPRISNSSVYLANMLYFAFMPFSCLCLFLFFDNISIKKTEKDKYIRNFIISFSFVLFFIVCLNIIPYYTPLYNSDILSDIFNVKFMIVLFSLYYFLVAVLTLLKCYNLFTQAKYKKNIPIMFVSIAIYFLYILYSVITMAINRKIDIVIIHFLENIIPLIAVLFYIKSSSTLGVDTQSLLLKTLDFSDEAVCIISNKQIKYANEKFYLLFFNKHFIDTYTIDIDNILPTEFLNNELFNNKILNIPVSYKVNNIDIVFTKSLYKKYSHIITILDVSSSKDLKIQTEHIENNLEKILNEDKEIIELTNINTDLEKQTRDFIDIQNQKILLETTDHLTGLSNRTFFKQAAHNILSNSKPNEHHIVIYLDLDNFKSINDTLGHDIGDKVLKDVSEKLKQSVPPNNIISRIGGDEFLIFVKHNPLSQNVDTLISKIAKNIITNLKKPLHIDDNVINTSVSIGFSIYPDCGKDIENLIKNADIAMYVSKNSGKNCYSIFEETRQKNIKDEFNLTNDMISSIQNEEFELYYQPQVKIVDGSTVITALESFIKWNHPTKGVISPREFIPLAEKSGYINEIANWVFDNVCIQVKKWNEKNIFVPVSINFSTPKFEKEHLYENIKKSIDATGLSTEFIRIELSEKYLLKNIDNTIETLLSLKDFGILIAIDNFGTEYSSLNYLKHIPIDFIKLNMSFIHGIGENEKDEAIILALVELCKNCNIELIAEGVQTKQQYEFLYKYDVRHMQGYYFYKPMLAKEFEELYFDINV